MALVPGGPARPFGREFGDIRPQGQDSQVPWYVHGPEISGMPPACESEFPGGYVSELALLVFVKIRCGYLMI